MIFKPITRLSSVAVLLLLTFSLQAQKEFLIKFDPFDLSFEKVEYLPNVKWVLTGPNCSTFDPIGRRYFFAGGSVQGLWQLYSVEVTSGSILTSAPISCTVEEGIGEFQFDPLSNRLYGLRWNNNVTPEKMYFISVDWATGAILSETFLPNISHAYIQTSFFDHTNQRYHFKGVNNNGEAEIYTIDAPNATILYAAANPGYIVCPVVDATQTIYGVRTTDNISHVVTIDPTTGVFDTLVEMPDCYGLYQIGTFGLDLEQKRYFFAGIKANGTPFMFYYDLVSGQTSSAAFDWNNFPTSDDNIVEPEFDPITHQFFALHWESQSPSSTSFQGYIENPRPTIYPNPIINIATIDLGKRYQDIDAFLYSANGAVVRSWKLSNVDQFSCSKQELPAGDYRLLIFSNGLQVGLLGVSIL